MKFRPLCQPSVSPDKRVAAERERNRRVLENTPAGKTRITNAAMPQDAPWVLFKEPAREDGEDHRRCPSRFGERSVFLHEWGTGSA